MENHSVGRPKVNIEEYFANIKEFLYLGYSLHKACQLGLVPYRTVKHYYDTDEDFSKKIDRERNRINAKARLNLVKKIEEGNIKISLEWLKHTENDEFTMKQNEFNFDKRNWDEL